MSAKWNLMMAKRHDAERKYGKMVAGWRGKAAGYRRAADGLERSGFHDPSGTLTMTVESYREQARWYDQLADLT